MKAKSTPPCKGRALLLSLAVLLVALSGMFWLGLQEPSAGPRQVLADGTVLELRGITYGTHHELRLGSWWHRTVDRWVEEHFPPAPSPGASGSLSIAGGPTTDGYVATFDSAQSEPVAWFRVRRTHLRGMSTLEEVVDRTMTRDQHGCLLPCITSGDGDAPLKESDPLPNRPTESLAAAEVRIYPRRQREYELGLYPAQGETALARFMLPNPSPSTAAAWSASPAPVRATADGIVCTLSQLRHQPDPLNHDNAQARFRCESAGSSKRRWRVGGLTVGDATGNVWPAHLTERGQSLEFQGLCACEPAWKLALSLTPPDPFRDPPDYLWKLRDLPVAPRNHYTPYQRSLWSGQMELQLSGIIGGGQVHTPTLSGMFPTPTLALRAQVKTDMEFVVLSVTDETGRERLTPKTRGIDLVGRDQGNNLDLELPPLTGARRFNVTIGATRYRNVELLVRP